MNIGIKAYQLNEGIMVVFSDVVNANLYKVNLQLDGVVLKENIVDKKEHMSIFRDLAYDLTYKINVEAENRNGVGLGKDSISITLHNQQKDLLLEINNKVKILEKNSSMY